MAEVLPWRFLIFAVAFGLLVYLQFYLAHREWRKLKGEEAAEIDVHYVRAENYLAQSFRMKVKEWLALPASKDRDAGSVILKGQERIRVLEDLELGADQTCEDILVVGRDFSCGSDCSLTRELLVHGNSNIGSGSRLQALAANGNLMLEEKVTVARWLDSTGELTMSAGCKVGARVTSLKRIRLGLEVEVGSAYAPEVATGDRVTYFPVYEPPTSQLLEIDFPTDSPAVNQTLTASGLERHRLFQLSPDTWVYKGDVRPQVPVRLTKKLIVKGDCRLPGGSVVEADVKATGSLFLGPSCVCQGNLVADGDIFLGPDCRFSGLIHAGKTLFCSRGARGLRPDGDVAAFAEQQVCVEANVVVRGKLASAGRVKVLNAKAAETWRVRRGIDENGTPSGRGHRS
jgi:cytoskeletal protein CcmA (bactofilin family)